MNVGDGEGNVDAKEGSTTEVEMIPDAVDPRLGPKGFPSPVEQYHYHHRRARTSTSAPASNRSLQIAQILAFFYDHRYH